MGIFLRLFLNYLKKCFFNEKPILKSHCATRRPTAEFVQSIPRCSTPTKISNAKALKPIVTINNNEADNKYVVPDDKSADTEYEKRREKREENKRITRK